MFCTYSVNQIPSSLGPFEKTEKATPTQPHAPSNTHPSLTKNGIRPTLCSALFVRFLSPDQRHPSISLLCCFSSRARFECYQAEATCNTPSPRVNSGCSVLEHTQTKGRRTAATKTGRLGQLEESVVSGERLSGSLSEPAKQHVFRFVVPSVTTVI